MLHFEDSLKAMNRVGRALADPSRCRILLAMLEGTEHPAELAERLGLSRANVSNHLACLRGCGLVTATPQGRQVRYAIANPELAVALRDLMRVVLAVDEDDDCLPVGATRVRVGVPA